MDSTSESDGHICPDCLDDIPFTWFWSYTPNPAEEKLLKKVGIVSAACLYFYRRGSKYNSLVKSVKYGGRSDVGVLLGRMLGERLLES